MISKKTYQTSALCPRCGKPMHTSDVESQGFVCFDCDDNFYGIEIAGINADLHKISFPMQKNVFDKLLEWDLRIFAHAYNIEFIGYDDDEDFQCCDIGWVPDFPESSVINEICVVMEQMIEYSTDGSRMYFSVNEMDDFK